MNKKLFRLRTATGILPPVKEAVNRYFVETFDRLARRCREFARRIEVSDAELRCVTVPPVVGLCAGCGFSPCQCERESVRNFWLAPGAFGGRCDPNVKFGTVACKPSAHGTLDTEKHETVRPADRNSSVSHADGACIGNVTDVATGLSNNTASAGKYLIIEGERIRVFPEDDAELGVFFVDAAGTRFRSGERLRHNDGKKVVVRVPENLAPGVYSLEIVTRFPSNGNLPGSALRTIRYGFPLQVS
jgi:hypothetical protein